MAALVLVLAPVQAGSEATPPPPAAAPDEGVAALNRAASAAASGGTQRIAADQDAYRRALADFQEAQRRNDAERAEAAAAADRYRADRASYETAMGAWQRQVQAVEQANASRRRVAKPATPERTGRSPACRPGREPVTGSLLTTTRRACTP